MWIQLILTLLSYAFGSFCKGIADTLQFHFAGSIFASKNRQYWDPSTSWQNKYKKDAAGKLIQPLRPRFPGSTTFLVWLTDGWHLFEALRNIATAAALCLLASTLVNLSIWIWLIILFALVFVIHAGAFHLSYSVLFVKKSSTTN